MRDVLWVSSCNCSQPLGTSQCFNSYFRHLQSGNPYSSTSPCVWMWWRASTDKLYCVLLLQIRSGVQRAGEPDLASWPNMHQSVWPSSKSVSISQLVFLSFLSYFSCRSINFQLQFLCLISVSTLQCFCSLCFHRYQSNYKTQVYGNGK